MQRQKSKRRSSLLAQIKRLDFDQVPLVGREKEMEQLKNSFLSGNYSFIGVSGHSGVGKTTLVETFANEIKKSYDGNRSGAWFLFGKFDSQKSPMPYSAISAVLKILASNYKFEIQAILEKNSTMSEEHLDWVLDTIPEFKESFADTCAVSDEGDPSEEFWQDANRSDQIRLALSSFFRACCADQKIVLCLDDVQWADTASLDLLELLSKARSNSNLTLILTWRTNAPDLERNQELQCMLGRCSPFIVEVGNLSIEALNELVSGVLGRKKEDKEVLGLTNVICHKTQGNVFFAKQVLMWLQRNKLLYYSLELCKWEWDISEVNAETNLADNLVAIVADTLHHLPLPSRKAVMVASCLGSNFDKSLVLELLDADVLLSSQELAPSPEGRPDFDLLERYRIINYRTESETYRFSHDEVQRAAYSLLENEESKQKTHFAIGQYLLRSSLIDIDLKQLLATDQLNLGAGVVKNDAHKCMMMQNNNKAALVALKKSAFVQAERFLRTALQLIPNEVLWSQHYDLAVSMNSSLAKTLVTLGKFDEVERIVDEVLLHAVCSTDTSLVLFARLDCLNSMNRLQEAFDFGYRHARRKVKLSRRPGKFHAIREFLRAKRFLKKMPIEYLLQAEKCNSVDLGYQRLLCLLADNAFLRDDEDAMMYLYLKLLNMAFVQGPSKCTGVGLVFYGAFLGVLKDLDASYEVSNWAIAMEDRFKSRAYQFRIHLPMYTFLTHLRQPLHSLLDPILDCYRKAMRYGDMMHACFNVTGYAMAYFHCGLNLNPLICDIRRYREVFLNKNGCDSIRCSLDLVGQMALNLTGASSDQFVLDGEFFDHEHHRTTIIEAGRGQVRLTYWCCYTCTGYILDPSSDHVMKAFNELYRSKNERPKLCHDTGFFTAPSQCMYFCLAAIALERRTGKRFYTRKRRLLTKIVQKFVDNGVPGLSHRLLLIEAETMALDDRLPDLQVKRAFDNAITTSGRTGFLHESAMANERCGEFFLRRRDPEWAGFYLKRAMELYGDWGAVRKVELMKVQHSFLKPTLDPFIMTHSTALRSRERYEDDIADRQNANVSQMLYDPGSSELSFQITNAPSKSFRGNL